jgi:hypothetical protein
MLASNATGGRRRDRWHGPQWNDPAAGSRWRGAEAVITLIRVIAGFH